MLKGFTRVAAMPQEVIEKYRDQVPSELVQVWEEDGLRTFLDGYLKKDATFATFLEDLSLFIKFLPDESFTDDYFDLPLYCAAVERYGSLDYAQCFGFVPLLALGGFKDVKHLDKVKMYEHISLITQLIGPIGD